jgi:hypothetical protein
MRRRRLEPREDLERVIGGLKFVLLVLFSLPVCVSLLILVAAVLTSGHRYAAPIFPLIRYGKFTLRRISNQYYSRIRIKTPLFCKMRRLNYNPLRGQLERRHYLISAAASFRFQVVCRLGHGTQAERTIKVPIAD